MERLTERFENGQVGVAGCGKNCKYSYKYCENAEERCPVFNEIYEKLAAYEDAEEQEAEVEEYRTIGTPEELQEMKKDFAEALSDWRQYRKVGTLEECRAAVEKQTAKRPRIMGNAMICPSCPRCFKSDNSAYCPSCGQKLKWEDEE